MTYSVAAHGARGTDAVAVAVVEISQGRDFGPFLVAHADFEFALSEPSAGPFGAVNPRDTDVERASGLPAVGVEFFDESAHDGWMIFAEDRPLAGQS